MKKSVFFIAVVFAAAMVFSGSVLAAGPEFLENSIAGEKVSALSDTLHRGNAARVSGGLYPVPELELTNLAYSRANSVHLKELPNFETEFNGRIAGLSSKNDFIFYTLDKNLQKFAKELIRRANAPHISVVAMDPSTGKILAIAEKSKSIRHLALHAGFPAASLFKIITTAAALEADAVKPNSMVHFRGGTYTLNKWNYLPDRKKDKRVLSVADALGMSCNAVFGRIALQHLSPGILRRYSERFGFNSSLGFEASLPESSAFIPDNDYELSRTAAGFGDVRISPVHAASLIAGIANEGLMPKPYLINHILSQSGKLQYQAKPETLRRIVSKKTAETLMKMLQTTTTIGTSRHEFYLKKKPLLPVSVAAKTGTLSGSNPKGLNQWFIAAAPIDNPKIAISVISVSPAKSNAKASRIGRQLIQKYLNL